MFFIPLLILNALFMIKTPNYLGKYYPNNSGNLLLSVVVFCLCHLSVVRVWSLSTSLIIHLVYIISREEDNVVCIPWPDLLWDYNFGENLTQFNFCFSRPVTTKCCYRLHMVIPVREYPSTYGESIAMLCTRIAIDS